MRSLPLLSSNFAYFSWENQFGKATSEQLQNAYLALTTNGLTTEFHRNVWNDIVDRLNQAITQSNLEWNTTYGTAAETKINEKYGILTARRFNALTINIDSILNNKWRWGTDAMFTGYVGRSRFFGVTEKDEDADYLYGNHILELVRVLNTFIAVLKNEANFSEFVIREKSKASTNTTAYSRKAAAMSYKNSSLTKYKTTAYSRIGRPVYLSLYSSSKTQAEALKKTVKTLTHKVSSRASHEAKISATHVARASYRESAQAPYTSSINSLKAGRMTSQNKSLADYQTSMNNPQAEVLGYQEIATALNESAALARDTKAAASEEISNVSIYADAIVGRPKFPIHESTSGSTAYTNVANGNPKQLTHAESSKTSENVMTATPTRANLVPKRLESMTNSIIKMSGGLLLELSSLITSVSNTKTSLAFDNVEEAWHVQSGNNLYIHQAWLTWQEDNNANIDAPIWYKAVQDGANLYIRSAWESGADAEDAYIDRPIWYKPKQNGSDLYIRQAESLERSDD